MTILKILAETKTNTAEDINQLFDEFLRQFLTKAIELSGQFDCTEQTEVDEWIDSVLEELDAPIEMIDSISWTRQVESHNIAGGASGKCTLYVKGDVSSALLGTTKLEIEEKNKHLGVKLK
jgi:hypothetical protein